MEAAEGDLKIKENWINFLKKSGAMYLLAGAEASVRAESACSQRLQQRLLDSILADSHRFCLCHFHLSFFKIFCLIKNKIPN